MKVFQPFNAIVHKTESVIAIMEGKKSKAKIGDIREIFKLLIQYDSTFEATSPDSPIYAMAQLSSYKRAKRMLAAKKAARKAKA